MNSHLLFFTGLLALGLPAQHLTPAGPASTGIELWDGPHGNHAPGAFTQTLAADITGSGYPDLILLHAGVPKLMVAPAMTRQILDLPGHTGGLVEEICVIPESGVGDDRVAMLGPDGLRVWSDGRTASLGGAAWQGASRLQFMRGHRILVAVNAARNELVLQSPDSSFAGTIARSTRRILEMVTLDWDADGLDEIAVVTSSGFEVVDLSGTRIAFFEGECTSAFGTRVGSPLGDMLTCVYEVPGFGQVLASRGQSLAEATLLNGDIVSIAAGDGNADGWYEIVLGSSTRSSVDLLWNSLNVLGLQFAYEPRGGFELTMSSSCPPSALNRAIPNVADLDGDGDTDLIYPMDVSGQVAVAFSPLLRSYQHELTYLGLNVQKYTHSRSSSERTRIDPRLDSSVGVPSGATDLQGVLWQLRTSANGLELNPLPFQSHLFPIVDGEFPTDFHFEFPTEQIEEQAVVLMLRYVQKGSNGEVVHAWPPATISITDTPSILTALLNLPGVQAYTGGTGGQPIGGVVKVGQLPPPPTGGVPVSTGGV